MEESYLTESGRRASRGHPGLASAEGCVLTWRTVRTCAPSLRWGLKKAGHGRVGDLRVQIRCVPEPGGREDAGRKPVVCRTQRDPPLSVRLPRPSAG